MTGRLLFWICSVLEINETHAIHFHRTDAPLTDHFVQLGHSAGKHFECFPGASPTPCRGGWDGLVLFLRQLSNAPGYKRRYSAATESRMYEQEISQSNSLILPSN